MNEYRKTSHSVYLCDYHLILATKYRRRIFNEGLFKYVKRKLLEICDRYPQIFIKEMNHDKDHIHFLISIPPQMSVGSVVRLIKSNTSRKLKNEFPFLKEVYWGSDGIWSDGYFVSTVGINKGVIENYIRLQGAEDSGRTAKLFEAD